MSALSNEFWKDVKEKQAELKKKIEKDPWRLTYHAMPETGWLNDPNGLCQFNGVYHFYHQYYPAAPNRSGSIHWAHKTSTDMIHFKEEKIFLSPEESYDKDGVYSGSAFIKDGKIHFFYTGNVKQEGDHDYTYSGREHNTVHVVSEDGFNVSHKKVVISHDEYPDKYTNHIRDPKVFEKNGMYYMIIGGRTVDHTGEILLYQSKDLYDWEYKSVLLGNLPEMGFMWECPDYFEINGQSILLFSPQGMPNQETKYQNVYQTGYFTGEVDWEAGTFTPDAPFKDLDYGFDLYAAQTFEDEQKRRILVGWMAVPDTEPEYHHPTASRGWQHALTIPRELVFENGTLKQKPLKEFDEIRAAECSEEVSSDTESEVALSGDVYELLIDIADSQSDLDIYLRQDTHLHYSKEKKRFTLEFGRSGYGRRARHVEIDELEDIRIFSDTSSIEIFINDGEFVLTSRVYPEPNQDQIEINGTMNAKITKWDLK